MSARAQRWLAISVALAAVIVVLAANAHLVSAALRSQPACVVFEGAGAPAKRAC